MNSYNFVDGNMVVYHAIAENRDRAIELAKENNLDIEGLEVELERYNVRDQLGRPFSERIEDARVS